MFFNTAIVKSTVLLLNNKYDSKSFHCTSKINCCTICSTPFLNQTLNRFLFLKVWAPPQEATTRPPSTVSRPVWSSVAPVFTTTTTTTTTTASPRTTTTKKSKTYNKHPNEVVKSEELTLGGGATRPSRVGIVIVAVLCVLRAWR